MIDPETQPPTPLEGAEPTETEWYQDEDEDILPTPVE